jgi:flagellar biosynthetic protein FliR
MDVPASQAELVALFWAHAAPFTLVLFRILGIFISAPMLATTAVPARIRVLLAFMLALATYPALIDRLDASIETDIFGLIPMVLGETLVGFCIGTMAAMPLLAVEGAGIIAGHQMGLSLARVYNPQLDTESDMVGQLLFFAAFAAYLAMGGMESLFDATAQSFDRIPLGGIVATDVPLDAIVGMMTSGLELALRVAAPVTGVIILLAITMGALSKTMPQINIMTVGFAVKVLAGVLMLAFGVSPGVHAVVDEIDDTGKQIVAFINTH